MAIFPGAVATTDDLHTGVNNLQTALSAGIDAVVTTVPVADTTGFPSVGAITIDTERISYTSIDPTNFLGCTRGYGSTTAASHLIGAATRLTYGAEYHNDVRDEVIAIEQNLSTRIGLSGTTITPTFSNGSSGAPSMHFATSTTLGWFLNTVPVFDTWTFGRPGVPIFRLNEDSIMEDVATRKKVQTITVDTNMTSPYIPVTLIDATAANVTFFLDNSAGPFNPDTGEGRIMTFKRIDSSVNTVLIDAATIGVTTIDGAANFALTAQYKYVTTIYSGGVWHIIANN